MNTTPLKLLISIIGFALIWFGYKGITKGAVRIKGGFNIAKKEKPALFWINVCIYFVVGIAALLYGLVS